MFEELSKDFGTHADPIDTTSVYLLSGWNEPASTGDSLYPQAHSELCLSEADALADLDAQIERLTKFHHHGTVVWDLRTAVVGRNLATAPSRHHMHCWHGGSYLGTAQPFESREASLRWTQFLLSAARHFYGNAPRLARYGDYSVDSSCTLGCDRLGVWFMPTGLRGVHSMTFP